jgi:pyruvate formate lyase activating enzyme
LELKSGFKINKRLCNECGDCARACPAEALKFVGRVVSVDEVLDKIKKDRPFYLTSRGGLTISGGEPLYQIQFTHELLKRTYEEGINTAIETCGNVPWRNYELVLPYLDAILYDIKHVNPAKHVQGTGKSNRLILSNLKKLSDSGMPMIIRLPLIPKFNLEPDNILRTARLVSSLRNVIEVNLLPFHQLGKDKYLRLGKEYSLKDLQGLDLSHEGVAKIKKIQKLLESFGLNVKVG